MVNITTAGYFAIAAIVAGTAVSVNASKQAASDTRRAEKKSAALARARDAFLNAQRTKQAIAQARVGAAQARAIGEAQGVGTSSSVEGAAGSLFSQTAGQIGASQVEQSAAFGINNVNYNLSKKLSDYNTQSQIGQGIASIGSAVFSSGAGFSSQTPSYGAPGAALSSRNASAPQAFNFSQYAQSWGNRDLMQSAGNYYRR